MFLFGLRNSTAFGLFGKAPRGPRESGRRVFASLPTEWMGPRKHPGSSVSGRTSRVFVCRSPELFLGVLGCFSRSPELFLGVAGEVSAELADPGKPFCHEIWPMTSKNSGIDKTKQWEANLNMGPHLFWSTRNNKNVFFCRANHF